MATQLTAGGVRRMLANSHVDASRLTISTYSRHVAISGPIEARRHTWPVLVEKGLTYTPTVDRDEWTRR